MSGSERSVEIYSDTVDQIRRLDFVTPIEHVRRETYAFLGVVPQARTEEEVEALLPGFRQALERPLAIALALLDFGGDRGERGVGWMLQTVADELGRQEAEPTEPFMALALRDLAFSLSTDCLARNDLSALPRIASVAIPNRFDRDVPSVFQAVDLRHPNAFQRGADKAFLASREWLGESSLVSALSHVRDREAYLDALSEAELMAALIFAKSDGESTFCSSVGSGGGAERRLRRHAQERAGAIVLAACLNVEVDDLAGTLNHLYGLLVGPHRFGTRGPLIPEED